MCFFDKSVTIDLQKDVIVPGRRPAFERRVDQRLKDVPDFLPAFAQRLAYSPPSLIMTGISESLSRQGSDGGDLWPGKRLPSRNTWSGSTRRNAIDLTS